MRRRIIAMLTAAFLIIPGFSVAQRHVGGEGQQNLKSSTMKASMGMMQGNMALMAEITDKMQQMMSTERVSPEQQSQILNMMDAKVIEEAPLDIGQEPAEVSQDETYH